MMAETRKILGDDGIRGLGDLRARARLQSGTPSRSTCRPRETSRRSAAARCWRFPGRRRRGRARARALPDADRRRRPRRGAGRADPPRPHARALPEHLGRRRQPAQGRRHQRRPARRAARRARPGAALRAVASGRLAAKLSSAWRRHRGVCVAAACRSPLARRRRQPAPLPPRDVYAEAPRPDQVSAELALRRRVVPGRRPTERYQVLRDGEPSPRPPRPKLIDAWLAESRSYSYVVRAIDAGGGSADVRAARGHDAAVHGRARARAYLQQLDAERVDDRLADLRARDDEPLLRACRRAAVNVARDAGADAAITSSMSRTSRPAPPTATAGSRTAGSARPASFRTPPLGPAQLQLRRDRRLRDPTPAARANLRRLVGRRHRLRDHHRRQRAVYRDEQEYRDYVLAPAARACRQPAASGRASATTTTTAWTTTCATSRSRARALLQLHLRRRAVPVARLEPLRRAAQKSWTRVELRQLAGALQGRLLPPPALVERPRLPQPRSQAPAREVSRRSSSVAAWTSS